MNTFVVVFLVAVVAIATASDRYYDNDRYGGYGSYGYQPGFRKVANGIAAPYNNAARQQGVNHLAEHVGASSGTARYYGVPGTGLNFGNRHGDNYGNKNYGYQSYGYKKEYRSHQGHDRDYRPY